ncbi:class I adenylate-forming enzyme family protein [Paraburkholderia saeva]|uniref:Long-chain-fatty-acid--CoA ligase FadD13 n=1 Tax=Paraburkholderia saeva TaxID=2777537 RepID=A0A9N8RX98_9BURK|nr:AMP-binding protein [Paraburkholderia saeva]CAG4901095.1 Long-chain-fatty-acid--CoA ligase FadD13 [Paraburkholderia saeva]CAG4923807.1 Long-chain-fatty-acid--CoA ligase FadD13 [Paraburkholderia saeva]CAG4925515.1 Long-chain-fatty-acid--CoA ligase FadD13 [Paraburkholderia saeva]
MNIISLFDDHVRQQPDKPFLRYAGRTYTYAQVDDLSRRAATVLIQHGVGTGDRFALMCLNTPGFMIAMLGAWRIGAAVVPINHKLQAPEVDYILSHARVKLALFDGALAPVVERLTHSVHRLGTESELPGHPSFDALLEHAAAFDGPPPADESIAEVLYTSGTTGRPKGCLHSHRSACHAGETAVRAASMEQNERTLIAMPLWHSSPLNNWMLGTLYVGGTIVLLREYHPEAFLRTVQDERVTLYFGAPVSYLLPLQMGLNVADFDLGSVRAWIYGGGPIGAETARRLMNAYRSERFYQMFGMTETGPAGTVLYPEEQIAKAGSIGRVTTPGAEMKIIGKDGREAKAGEVGEIWLRCSSLMQRYLDAPDATAEAIVDGWYRSGDLVRVDEDGYLFVVDRSKDMIVTGGENVYSKEVEDVLIEHPAVRDVAVVGRPHPEWGETVVAFIVPNPDATVDRDAINAWLAPRLAKYKIPREYLVRESLPRTPTGKLTKASLRACEAWDPL